MSWNWPEFIKVGDKLFEYMNQYYFSMITNNRINHFNIRYGICRVIDNVKEIKRKYINLIHDEILIWITEEHLTGKLFEKTNWKPFRDQYYLNEMYLGYKFLFKFKNYYFQLGISEDCEESCMYCDGNETNIHFELALFGWLDSTDEKLQPDGRVIVSIDNSMPDWYWNRK